MIENKKLSLSLINTTLLIVFLVLLLIGISISGYFTTQKVINYNINEYFNQTNNITKIILEDEQENLNELSFEIAKLIRNKNINSDEIEKGIDSIIAVDQIDLLFLKKENKTEDYSNSLFDTYAIMKKIIALEVLVDNIIVPLEINEEKYVILLSIKKIIDQETGRVEGKLYVGKVLNDNFSILNRIKVKANLENVFIYFKNDLIATTSNSRIPNFSLFAENKIVKEKELIYVNIKDSIASNEILDFVFAAKNSTFELFKNEFTKIGYFVFIFVFLLFMLFYFLSNKLMIKPFSRLLAFAKMAKDDKNIIYRESKVAEFDNFAVDLKTIIDELRDLKEQYSRAIEGVEDGLWDYDLKTKKFFYSNRFRNMLKLNLDDNIDTSIFWKNSIHKDDYLKTLRKLVEHIKGKTSLYEDNYRFLCKDGTYKWIRVRGKAFFNEHGKVCRITGFHTDIDDFIKLQNDNVKKEQMLYQQSKLASMGEMIGNIAHQWRQPLNVISTIISGQMVKIEMGISNEKDTLEDLNQLNDTVQYLSTIIDKFRYFFNPNKELEEFYIDEAIIENMQIFEASYTSSGIELIINPKSVKLLGYKFELMQVIVNIINNSKDALTLKYDIDEKKYIFLDIEEKENFVLIKIYDNAGGVDSKIKDKIYEPYYTTKHQSQGTGLGLYMSSEIIKKHFKGELSNETIKFSYKDTEYEGEEFVIKLPL